MIPKFSQSKYRCVLAVFLLFVFTGTVFAATPADSGKRYAVCIGINDYADSSIVKLTTARNDAVDLGQELLSVGWDKVFVLKDDVDYRNQDFPSRTNIENRVNLLADLVKPEDTIFLFFSGHGISDGKESSILPVDASLSRLRETSISLSSLISTFNNRGIKKVIVAVDACREQVATTKGLSVVGITDTSSGNAAALTLYATKAGWYSYEDTKGRNGVFTRFILEGLEGKADGQDSDRVYDGIVTFSELAAWLPDATGSYALDQGIRQQAVISKGSGANTVLEEPASLVSSSYISRPVAWKDSSNATANTAANAAQAETPVAAQAYQVYVPPLVISLEGKINTAIAQSLKNIDSSLANQFISAPTDKNTTVASVVTDNKKDKVKVTDSAAIDNTVDTTDTTETVQPQQETPAKAKHGFSILQVSFFWPIQAVPKDYHIFGIAVGAIQTQNDAVYGIQTAPITAATSTMGGIQTGVICTAGNVYGLQSSAIVSHAADVYGMQCGLINNANKIYGVQCGLINTAKQLYGAQLGLINVLTKPGLMGKFMFGMNIGF